MTMPDERARAVIETKQFLQELVRDSRLQPETRRQAKVLLRHYPDERDVMLIAQLESYVIDDESDPKKRDFFLGIYDARFWRADGSKP